MSIGAKLIELKDIIEAITTLKQRIHERLPESKLENICQKLLTIAQHSKAVVIKVNRPVYFLRVINAAIISIMSILLGFGLMVAALSGNGENSSGVDLLQGVEAAINIIVFSGIAIFFLSQRLEKKVKQGESIDYLNSLRSIAHLIDLEQLTKDPQRLMRSHLNARTFSSPTLQYDRFLLNRFLSYCSEMLSLISQLAAYHAENVDDRDTIDAANDIERLTGQMAQKIWQKLTVLEIAFANGKIEDN
jgi:hypothetical protein